MIASGREARSPDVRFAPWLARFRRSAGTGPELSAELIEDTAAAGPLRVLFRGCLHNRAELAEDLERAAHGDAELVLEAYRRWGEDSLRHLRGIFALFIWDGERRVLLAARDPLGVEPLFYARAGEELLFAASPATLIGQPGVPRRPNRLVLAELLSWRWPVPEETCLEPVRRLLPGHVLVIDGAIRSRRYWDPLVDLHERGWVDPDELVDFDRLLERAVSRCFDVGRPAVFLSGGLDSAGIAAVALDVAERRKLPAPTALSLVFRAPELEEGGRQVAVADVLGLPRVLLGAEESTAPDGFLWRALELGAGWPLPMKELWAAAYQQLARHGARQGADVILTGAGGDEWLTVDLLHAADLIQSLEPVGLYRFVRSKTSSFETPVLPTLRALLWTYGLRPVVASHLRPPLERLAPELLRERRRRGFAGLEPTWLSPDRELRADLRDRLDALIGRSNARSAGPGRFRFYGSSGTAMLDQALLSEEREYDYEAGRRAGVQVLHPYWEPDLVSFLYRVPPELLLRGGREKGLIRSTVASRFPNLGFERQKKVVSADYYCSVIRREAPAAWRRLGGCDALAELGIVDPAQVRAAIGEDLQSSDRHDLLRVWHLLAVESWLRAAA